jgi:hypothetical protein
MRDDPLTPSAEPVISKDAYDAAREDLAIWKKRALEAETLNRKFAAAINGPTFMGEPAPSAEPINVTGGHGHISNAAWSPASWVIRATYVNGTVYAVEVGGWPVFSAPTHEMAQQMAYVLSRLPAPEAK